MTRIRFHLVCGGKKGTLLYVGKDAEWGRATLEAEDGFPADVLDDLRDLVTGETCVDSILGDLPWYEETRGLAYKIEMLEQSDPPIFATPFWRPRLVTA